MSNFLNKLGFAAVSLVLAPVTTIGYLLVAGKIIAASRREEVSMTASSPLSVRWILDEFGQRDDDAARRLLEALPGLSATGINLVLGPTLWASRLSGYTPGLFQYPFYEPSSIMTMMNARTTFFDEALGSALADIEQVVFLGAGWDTRAYALPESLNVFEVNEAKTQRQKLRAIAEASIDTAGVAFVAVDFNRESWVERLEAEGFDPAKRTFVLWEGVTYYLDPASARETLGAIARLAPGSQVAFDYFSQGWIDGTDAPLLVKGLKPALKLTGEQWGFGIPVKPDARTEATRFVAAQGLDLARWEPLGKKQKPFGGLVLATVKPTL